MSELIDRDAFLKQERKWYCENCDRRKGVKNGRKCFVYEIGEVPCRACDVDDVLDDLECFETIDASPWHRVEDGLPDDEVPVLAMLHNTYGRNVVLKLCHIGHHKRTTEEYGWQEYEGETEYDEENDCFWIPEGWWESNYHEDNLNWEIDETDGTITHWMPLPEPPKEE